jgi:hypothetical protein
MTDSLLNVGDYLPAIGLVPAAVQLFGRDAKLNHEIAGQVFGFNLASLFPPQPDQRRLITAHNDPGIRAADEVSPLS